MVQGSYPLFFKKSSGLSLVSDTLISDTECRAFSWHSQICIVFFYTPSQFFYSTCHGSLTKKVKQAAFPSVCKKSLFRRWGRMAQDGTSSCVYARYLLCFCPLRGNLPAFTSLCSQGKICCCGSQHQACITFISLWVNIRIKFYCNFKHLVCSLAKCHKWSIWCNDS